MRDADPRVLILGLDGATFDLVGPWVEEGHLPNLAALMGEGAAVPLRSTTPPITPPAWTSMFTGRNPGKHRIFDFAEPDEATYALRYLNGGHVQGPSLWGLLNRQGHRATVVNVPMTYPPRPLEGDLVAGLDAPDESFAFTHPRGLFRDICDAVGGYRIDIRHLGNMRDDRRRDQTLEAFLELEHLRGEAVLWMMRERPSPFTFVVFNATDQVQHHFWHYMDPDHPRYDAEGAERYGDAILRVYQAVDREIGRLVEAAGPETPVLVVSDHGAGPTSGRAFHVNQYLAERGLLAFQGAGATSILNSAARAVDSVLRRTLSSGMKSRLAAMFPGVRSNLESMATAPIDWGRTRAFVQEAYLSSPNVWINRRSRFKEGTVSAEDYEAVREEVRAALLEVTDPATGRRLLGRVYRREEVFDGPFLDLAPDLILPWWEEDAFMARSSSPRDVGRRPAVHPESGPLEGGLDFVADHRMDGMLVMARAPFRAGAEPPADIHDITPTVLHLMGAAVPRDLDGRVLTDALEPGWLAEHPVRYEQSEERADDELVAYSEEEERKIRERLQGIGYLE